MAYLNTARVAGGVAGAVERIPGGVQVVTARPSLAPTVLVVLVEDEDDGEDEDDDDGDEDDDGDQHVLALRGAQTYFVSGSLNWVTASVCEIVNDHFIMIIILIIIVIIIMIIIITIVHCAGAGAGGLAGCWGGVTVLPLWLIAIRAGCLLLTPHLSGLSGMKICNR